MRGKGSHVCGVAGGPAEAGEGPHDSAATALDGSRARESALHDQQEQQRVPLHLRLVRRGEQAVAPFSLLLQTALYLRSAGGLTLQQHLHQAVLLLLRGGALVAFTLMRHDTWLRRRVWIIGAFRLAIAQLPSQRRAGEGDAVLLDCDASPGGVGLLRDWLRFLMGTRLLPMAVVGAVLQQPPLAVLVQQALLMYITSDTAGFCASQLAADPLSAARFSAAVDIADALTPLGTPLTSPDALKLTLAPAESAEAVRCAAIVPLHQCVVGVALPVLVAAAAGTSLGSPTAVQGTVQPVQQQSSAGECQPAPCRRRLLRSMGRGVCRTAIAFDGALKACCRGASLPQQCIAAYLLLGHFWALSTAVALRSAAAG